MKKQIKQQEKNKKSYGTLRVHLGGLDYIFFLIVSLLIIDSKYFFFLVI